jgi:urease accessory protein
MAWLSPGYPVGAYAYSHGLEWAVEAGDVRDEASLTAWLHDVCERGALRNDLILAAQAHAAARTSDGAALVAVNDLALALAPSRELHLETSQQGRSFLDATRGAWPCDALAALAEELPGPVAYPVAVGLAAGAHGMAPEPVLAAYGLAFLQESRLRRSPGGARGAGRRHAGRRRPRPAPRGARRGGRRVRSRRPRCRHLPPGPRLLPPRDPVFPHLPILSPQHDFHERPPPRRHRRTCRFRQDRPDGAALQALPRPLRDLRHHQRHLHEGGRPDPDRRGRPAGGAHPRRRDRRVSAHGDPPRMPRSISPPWPR